MNEVNLKRGDLVGFVFGQPGNNTTYVLLTAVRSDDADGWDLFFDMELKGLELSQLWVATERDLEIRGVFAPGKPVASLRQLAEEVRQRLGLDA